MTRQGARFEAPGRNRLELFRFGGKRLPETGTADPSKGAVYGICGGPSTLRDGIFAARFSARLTVPILHWMQAS